MRKNRFITLFMILGIVCSLLVSCKFQTQIPDKETAARYSKDELEMLASKIDEKELIKTWGEPEVINNRRFWTVPFEGATEYLVAYVENGDIVSLNKSYYLYVTVITDDYCVYGRENYATNGGDIAQMPTFDAFDKAIEYDVGDQFVFQFDGMIMETYPAQLNQPYSATYMGHLSDEEINKLVDECTFLTNEN